MMLTHDDYTVGWVCALSVESAAAIALLDVRHEPLPTKRSHNNNYTFGRILDHNVVIAVLPSGRYGTTSAATVVTEMKDAFTNIRFYLMVGIGGGVPTKYDVRLGDIVVSKPFGKHGGIIQYDYGKQTGSGRFELTGSLNKPPQVLLTALANLDSNHFLGTRPFHTYLTKIIDKYPKFCHPGKNQDVLFEPHYEHLSGEDCSACHRAKVKVRRDRDFSGPVIHYGLIASGNRVIKHAPTRDRLADEHDILCFEMEAAGLMDTIPCLVIRGICDYSDSHKNKAWQPYAAAAAAAYGKELLSHVPLLDVELKSPTSPGLTETLEKLRSTDVEDDRSMLLAIKGKRAHGTCEWLTEDCRYMTWLHSQGSKLLWVSGGPGKGKTMLAIYLTQVLEISVPHEGGTFLYYFCDNQDENRKSTVAILKGLLYQIISQRPWLAEIISTDLQNMNLPRLWKLFATLLKSSDLSNVVCVVDGLDECEKASLKPFLEYLREFFAEQDNKASTPTFKLLLLSREQPDDIKGGLGWASRIDLDSPEHSRQVGNDIEKYITSIFQDTEISGDLSPYQIELIKNTLRDRAECTFLWVGFMADSLKGKDKAEVKDSLWEIPKSVGEIYKRILYQIQPGRKELVALILHWVVLALRPLRIEELEAAIRTDNKYEDIERSSLINQVRSCQPLLKIENDAIHLVHQSAKEYLLSVGQDEGSIKTYFSRREHHAILAHSCLKYCEANYHWLRSPQRHTFLDYASRYWPVHLRNAGNAHGVFGMSTQFFQEPSEARDQWWNYYFEREQGTRAPKSFTLLHLSAYFGLESLAIEQLQRKRNFMKLGHPANKKDSWGRTPLLWAAARGQDRIVKLLRKFKASINVSDKGKLTALHLAARGDHLETVSLLLAENANPEVQSDGFTPLTVAIGNSSQSMVELILQHGAKLDPVYSSLGVARPEYGTVQPKDSEECEALARDLIRLQPQLLQKRLIAFSESLTVPIALSLAVSPLVARFKPCSSLLKRTTVKLIQSYIANDGEKVKAMLDKGQGSALIEQAHRICRLQLGTRNKDRITELAKSLGDIFVDIIVEIPQIFEWWDLFAVPFLEQGFELDFRDVLETWFTIGVCGTAKAIQRGKFENMQIIWKFGVESFTSLLAKKRQAEAIAIMRWIIMNHVIACEIGEPIVTDTIFDECSKITEELVKRKLMDSFIFCMSTAWSREILHRIHRKEFLQLEWTFECCSQATFLPNLPFIAGEALFKAFTDEATDKSDIEWVFTHEYLWCDGDVPAWVVHTETWHIEAAMELLQLIVDAQILIPEFMMEVVPLVLKRAEMEGLAYDFTIEDLRAKS